MPRETFQQELDGLVSDLLDLGGEVEASLENMVKAMEGRDAEVASRELGVDVRYKARGMEIERECMILQARQAPVARDLRLLYTVQSVTNHLVRSGTLSEHICQAIVETAGCERDEDLEIALVEMARTARNVFNEGLDVFRTQRHRQGPRPAGQRRQGGPPVLRGHEPYSQPFRRRRRRPGVADAGRPDGPLPGAHLRPRRGRRREHRVPGYRANA